jgi:hypothetical protein
MFKWFANKFGQALAWYLDKQVGDYATFSVTPLSLLRRTLQPGDILLVEGNLRVSVAIKYLTQSCWSHAAFYIGESHDLTESGAEPNALIEADIANGVIAVPLSKYRKFNTRICRPIGLTDEDRKILVDYMISAQRRGMQYDLKNIVDLLRYLIPKPPVPKRFRRRMLALGSGDPTRTICSSLIARAFQRIRYPILPHIREQAVYDDEQQRHVLRDYLHIRHHSLYTPRDFDLSPYFQVVKPSLAPNFSYKDLPWYEDVVDQQPDAGPSPNQETAQGDDEKC